MTKLILIRHGESEANREHYFAGQYDAELMPRGREQAEMTAEYVFRKYSPEKIYASDLSRAYSTAEPISRLLNAEIIKEPGLREIFAGRWQKMTFNDLEKKFPEEYGIWKADIGNAKCPEGETVKELGERVMKTLDKIAKENWNRIVTNADTVYILGDIGKVGSNQDTERLIEIISTLKGKKILLLLT